MTTHLAARRTAQAIAKIARHVRRHGAAKDAQAAFRCGDVIAVPSGMWRAWRELFSEIERARGSVSPP